MNRSIGFSDRPKKTVCKEFTEIERKRDDNTTGEGLRTTSLMKMY